MDARAKRKQWRAGYKEYLATQEEREQGSFWKDVVVPIVVSAIAALLMSLFVLKR